MSGFFRFPRTPHLAWLGSAGMPRDEKVLSTADAEALLSGDVVVEEKLDGANLGFSLDLDARLRVQNRGQYLAEPYVGEFARLPSWLLQHADVLHKVLTPDLMLFGEWCAAKHSLHYSALSDWFLLFDVYDRAASRFWCSARRNALAQAVSLATVPSLFFGHITLATLRHRLTALPSRYRAGEPMEGVVVRRESADWCEARAKLVHPDFIQSIDTHWRRRTIEWNRVGHAAMVKT